MKIYLVGGAVRDKLMGVEPKDKDYVIVGATQKDIEKLIKKGFKKVGQSFPVFLHPETKDEYALARKEKKVGEGYHGFDVDVDSSVTLKDDLKRRDLTINAIAYDEEKDSYIDPYNGMKDIENKILRNTSEAFREDPLRILRVARFSCKYPDFKIAESLKDEIKFLSIHTNEIKSINNDRILKELKKTWIYDSPSRFFYSLDELGVLSDFFPLIAKLRGQIQDPKYHPEGDSFIHTMMVYDNILKLTKDEDCILASLLHDLGKGETLKEELPRHIDHENKGVPLVESFCNRFNLGKRQTNFIKLFTKFHLKIHRCMEMNPNKIVKLMTDLGVTKKDDVCYEKLRKFLLCARSDSLGKMNQEYKQENFLLRVYNAIFNFNRNELVRELRSKNRADLIEIKIYEKKISLLKKIHKDLLNSI